jgi:hypothetical protein
MHPQVSTASDSSNCDDGDRAAASPAANMEHVDRDCSPPAAPPAMCSPAPVGFPKPAGTHARRKSGATTRANALARDLNAGLSSAL